MEQKSPGVIVWGDYACFTRPEFKVERVSYPVMPPSAARGLLEAIYWKPEFRYEIEEIWVLKLGSQTTILRNELEDRQGASPIIIEDKRQQRSSLILRDVKYLIRPQIVLPRIKDSNERYKKHIGYIEQLKRRLEKGQYHHTPYLGTREFAASFEPAQGNEKPQELDMKLGTMLFDTAFVQDEQSQEKLSFYRHYPDGRQLVNGYARRIFFHAELIKGRMYIPQEKHQELYALEK